jgi:SmpA / OmlA family
MVKRCVTLLKRHRQVLAVGGVVLAIATAVLVALWPVPLEERVRRIQPGMTASEVEEIMGLPHGNYREYYGTVYRGGFDPDPDNWWLQWLWDDATVTVWFDSEGRAKRADYRPDSNLPTLLERWRYQLEW